MRSTQTSKDVVSQWWIPVIVGQAGRRARARSTTVWKSAEELCVGFGLMLRGKQ
jgi:hypothetical protein